MSNLVRLDKFLAEHNVGTRKEVGIYIRKGFVQIDGEIVKDSAKKFDPDTAIVCYNGTQIDYHEFMYIMLNKPKGILSATRDNHAPTVLNIIPDELKRKDMFPAGRLDKDTTGLLIITDDGELAHKMLAPKSHVIKNYKATLDLPVNENDIKAFADGIKSGENQFLPANLQIDENDDHIAYVKIREGKFHQVKRMFVACGKTVVDLERLSIGALELDKTLEQGQCRQLTAKEVLKVFE